MRVLITGAVILLAGSLAHAACVGPAALESKLRAHPHSEIFTEIGKWFGDHHQYSCAIESYRSALKLSPKNLSAHLRLAAVLEELHKKEDAKAEWQKTLDLDPQSLVALDGLSRHLIAEGDYAGAIALLRNSKLNETLTLDLAQAYGKAGMLKEAEDILAAALAKERSYPLVNALATVYVNEGQREKARQLSQQFAAAHPSNADAQTLHLRLLLLTNNTADALPLAHKLVSSHPRDPYLLYICGTLEHQTGDFEAARSHLQSAVALQPDVYQSHYSLGVVLLKLNDLRGAKEHLQKAIDLNAPDPEVHLELATVLRKLGETQASEHELSLYRGASQSNSNTTVAESNAIRAQQELDSGDARRGVELYRQALDAAPGDALLNYKLSVALDKLGDVAGERQALEAAVKIDPDMAAAHNQLGYLASRSGDMAAAEQHFREAVRAAPAFTDAWINLAATLGAESKVSEAQQAIETALKLDPANPQALQLRQELASTAQSALNLGLTLYETGDYANAHPQFEAALKQQPGDARIVILLADTDLHLNRAADALALLDPLAPANSQNLDFESVYGSALIAAGHRREGVQHLEKVAESAQNAEAYMIAGEALLALDEYDRARQDLEAALRLNPALPRIHTLVGVAQDKLGNTAVAESAFREALKIDPDDFQANLYLGAILSQRRELQEAKPYLDRALKLNPTDPMIRYESAMLKSASGEYEAAAAELEQLEKTQPDWLEPHVALATLYYKVHRPDDGARERQIVDRLTAEQQARGTKSE